MLRNVTKGETHKDTKIWATAADTLFGSRAEGALVLELIHALVRGLAVRCTLRDWPLPPTTVQVSRYSQLIQL